VNKFMVALLCANFLSQCTDTPDTPMHKRSVEHQTNWKDAFIARAELTKLFMQDCDRDISYKIENGEGQMFYETDQGHKVDGCKKILDNLCDFSDKVRALPRNSRGSFKFSIDVSDVEYEHMKVDRSIAPFDDMVERWCPCRRKMKIYPAHEESTT
jgi:hypothetical protein